eukprot:351337-Chlamydomonas_euryale.AAC.3
MDKVSMAWNDVLQTGWPQTPCPWLGMMSYRQDGPKQGMASILTSAGSCGLAGSAVAVAAAAAVC